MDCIPRRSTLNGSNMLKYEVQILRRFEELTSAREMMRHGILPFMSTKKTYPLTISKHQHTLTISKIMERIQIRLTPPPISYLITITNYTCPVTILAIVAMRITMTWSVSESNHSINRGFMAPRYEHFFLSNLIFPIYIHFALI